VGWSTSLVDLPRATFYVESTPYGSSGSSKHLGGMLVATMIPNRRRAESFPLTEVNVSRFPWKSLCLMLDLDRQIEIAFEDLIHKPWRSLQWEEGRWPVVDVYETDEEYVVVADLPGVAPTDLKVTVIENQLTIQGTRELQSGICCGQTVRIERECGEFCRRIAFDQAVHADVIESRFEHGQLIVRLTKRSQANATDTPQHE